MPKGRPRKSPASKSNATQKKGGKTVAKTTPKSVPATSSAIEKKYEKYLNQEFKHVDAQIKQLMRHKAFLMKELGITEED